jgi:hypothetical protein
MTDRDLPVAVVALVTRVYIPMMISKQNLSMVNESLPTNMVRHIETRHSIANSGKLNVVKQPHHCNT